MFSTTREIGNFGRPTKNACRIQWTGWATVAQAKYKRPFLSPLIEPANLPNLLKPLFLLGF